MGGDIDELDAGWWDDLSVWFGKIVNAAFPSVTAGGNGGGHNFGYDNPWWGSEGGDFGGGGSSSSSSSSSSVVTPPPPETDHGYVASYVLAFYPLSTISSEFPVYEPVFNSSGLYSSAGSEVGKIKVNGTQGIGSGTCKVFVTDGVKGLIDGLIAQGKTVAIGLSVMSYSNTTVRVYAVDGSVSVESEDPYKYFHTDAIGSSVKCYSLNTSKLTGTVDLPIVYASSFSNDGSYTVGENGRVQNHVHEFFGIFNNEVPYGNPNEQPSGGNDNPSGGDPSGGEPSGPTQPTYGGDTYNETTNNYTTIVNNNGVDVDLSPVTSRQDAMKVTLNQIGTDLDTMAMRVDSDLKAMYEMQVLEVAASVRTYNLLSDIYDRLDTLDKSTGDLVDLTTLERYAREISDNTVPRTIDFTQFFNHFRTMEGDLDNLDTDLILIGHELGDMNEENGGATLRGIVYGIYELLQDMASDMEDMTSDLELVVQALDNMQDSNQLLTVRGYLKGIYDAITALETGGGSDTDYTDVLGDIYAEVEDIDLNLQAFATAVSDALDGISNDLLTVIRELRNLRIRNPQTPQTPTLPPSGDTLNIDALRDALSRLMQKFPFATINNLVHIMAFLVREPVAPVFDLPVPNPSDWSQPYMLRVDLSDFNQIAAVMRIGIVLWAIARISRRTVSMWTREEGGSGA